MRTTLSVMSLSAVLCVVCLQAAPGAHAEDGEDSVFCAWVQQVIAGTELLANVVTQTGYEGFVESKAGTNPLTVQQFWSNPVGADGAMPRVVSCKMKTAERINNAHQADGGEGAVAADKDESCRLVQSTVLEVLLNTIPRDELVVAPDTLRVDEEQSTFIGPMWLRPWPFEPLSRDDDGLLHLHSKSLYVPFAWWIPMPDRFKGTHYCHLVAPGYLEAVLRGELDPGV